jgi:hypothetical protein
MRFLPLLVLTGCGDSTIETTKPSLFDGDSGTRETGETAVEEVDADTDTDTDTDTDADADETGDPVPSTLTFVVDGLRDGLALTLTPVNFVDDGMDAGELAASAAVTGEVVELTVTPPEEVAALEGVPGGFYAWMLPALHEDGDGDTLHGDDEAYAGAGPGWVLWLEGAVDALAPYGLFEGWNAVKLSPTGELEDLYSTDEIPVATGLEVVESVTIGGSAKVAEGTRLVLYPGAETASEPLVDEELGEEWSISLEGAPPEDHLYLAEGIDLLVAVESPLAYTDADGSGDASVGDSAVSYACSGGDPVFLYYTGEITVLEAAAYFSLSGFHPGWMAFAVNEVESVELSDEPERMGLAIDGSCGP